MTEVAYDLYFSGHRGHVGVNVEEYQGAWGFEMRVEFPMDFNEVVRVHELWFKLALIFGITIEASWGNHISHFADLLCLLHLLFSDNLLIVLRRHKSLRILHH